MNYVHFMIAIMATFVFLQISIRTALVYFFVAMLILKQVDGPMLTIAALLAAGVLEFLVWHWYREPHTPVQESEGQQIDEPE